jgi:hypothetical protein
MGNLKKFMKTRCSYSFAVLFRPSGMAAPPASEGSDFDDCHVRDRFAFSAKAAYAFT